MINQHNSQVVRNISIFYVGAMLLAIGGGLIAASGQDVGSLLFILSPLIMILIVRFLLGDGWKDAGLSLKFKENKGWYLFAVLAFPIIFPVITVINALLGFISVTMPFPELLAPALLRFAMQLIPGTVFAIRVGLTNAVPEQRTADKPGGDPMNHRAHGLRSVRVETRTVRRIRRAWRRP